MEKHLSNGEAMADKDHQEHYTVSSYIPIYRCPIASIRLRYRPENLGRGDGELILWKFRPRKPCVSSKTWIPDEPDFKPNVIHLMSQLRQTYQRGRVTGSLGTILTFQTSCRSRV